VRIPDRSDAQSKGHGINNAQVLGRTLKINGALYRFDTIP